MSPAAPYSTLGHHCVDGIEILCYEDGSGSAWGQYAATRCPPSGGWDTPTTLALDCGNDTYFDAAPEAGSYLANYWNTGGPENPFLSVWPTTAPLATTTTAGSVGLTSAILNGQITPRADYVYYQFQYTTDADFQANGWSNAVNVPKTKKPLNGWGSTLYNVDEKIISLKENELYRYRVQAFNDAGGVASGAAQTFQTLQRPDAVTQEPTFLAGGVTVLHATVNPRGLETSYRFSWGRMDETKIGDTEWKSAGSGTQDVPASDTLAGLSPDVPHYVYAQVKNANGSNVGGHVYFTTPNWKPAVTAQHVTNREASTVTLNGSINPEGFNTTYRFEYGATSAYGSFVPVSPKAIGGGSEDVPVTGSITGLKPSTTYHFRIVATNVNGTTLSEDQSFTTAARAITLPASGIDADNAVLRGTVDSLGVEASYQFEYGTTAAYGSKAPASPKANGSGVGAVAVSEPLEGLSPRTTYHYRVLATNSEGTTYGEDMTFTTWGSWSIQSTPNALPSTPEAKFENVSCASSTSCMAVGKVKEQHRPGYVAVWNGSAWEAKVGNIDGSFGYGVSCVGTTCRTVGRSGGILWSDVWTESGGKWSLTKSHLLLPPSGATDPKLGDISCTSSSACTAVGSYVKEGKTMTLAQRWNGSAWSIQTTPNPESGNAELLGVSCEAVSSCTAVGKQGSSSYAMRWNGSSWSATSTPSPAGAAASDLQNVSCTSSSFCMAAGSFNESGKNKKTLALKWNGSSWSIATTPNPATNYGATLLGISCTSSSACTAVGRYVSATGGGGSELLATEEKTLALSWGGSEWAIQSSPNPEGKKFSLLRGVSCSAAAACTAVGNAETSEGQAASLGERWNGSSWSIQSTPNALPSTPEAKFENVSCASSTSCMAVGKVKEQHRPGYVAVWNGSAWEAKVGNIDGSSGYGVSCVGTTCRTVGRLSGAMWSDVWTESGGKWSLTKSHLLLPPSGATDPKLGDISCTSSSACTAVGSYVKEGKTMTLAQRWNGSAWSIQTTPNPESGNAELLGVSCEAASSCTAVGKQGSSSYAMRWNGSSWSATSTPSPAGAAASDLQNVSCTSSSFCMAAGSFNESGKNKKTLALKWNGSSWSIATTPNPATNYGATLLGISCTSSSACTAVGRYVSATGGGGSELLATEEKTLALSWGGSEWAIQSSPNPEGKKFSLLRGVSCSAAAACTAVGNAETSEGQAASLGERYQ